MFAEDQSESYTSSFLKSSISNHFNKSKLVTNAMITFGANDPTFFISLPFVVLALVGNIFSPLTGLGHGLFTAATRNLKSKSEVNEIPSYLKKFEEADDAKKITVIDTIVNRYEQKYSDSLANSDSSVELLELLKKPQAKVSLTKKCEAIRAYMVEPYDSDNKDNNLLKNNGKKMFTIIFDEISKLAPTNADQQQNTPPILATVLGNSV